MLVPPSDCADKQNLLTQELCMNKAWDGTIREGGKSRRTRQKDENGIGEKQAEPHTQLRMRRGWVGEGGWDS